MAAELPEEGENDDERKLIQRAQGGDTGAQDELCRQHLDGLYGWVRLKQRGPIQARESLSDLVQSVFREALVDLRQFEYRGPNSFRNWLLTRAINKLNNRHRHNHAERRKPEREVHEGLSRLYAAIATPSQVASARESVEQFEAAFARLGEADQRIIVMSRIERRSHAEIAAELGITEVASRKALNRAIVKLASYMQRDEEE